MIVFTSILNTLNSIPADRWTIIVEIVASAIIVSPVFVAVKNWFQIESAKQYHVFHVPALKNHFPFVTFKSFKLTGEQIMVVLVIFGSMLASAIAYLRTTPTFAPWFVFVQGWLVFGTTQPLYFLFFKPLGVRLGAYFTAQITKYAAVNEAKAAALPADGITISSTTSLEDFSQ